MSEASSPSRRQGPRLGGTYPYVSYLRVYEPLATFPEEQQLEIMRQRGRDRADTEHLEREGSLRRITRAVSDPYPHQLQELVRVLHYPTATGITTPYYCPNQLTARTTLAAESLANTIKGPLLDVLLPDAAQHAFQSRINPASLENSLVRLRTRSATWGVPFSWFVLMHEDDHTEVVEENGRIQTVRVAAPIALCTERARYAVANLAIAAPELDLLDELTDVTEWLDTFHRDAMVELDYGPVAQIVFPDESPFDVRTGIECLAEADMTGAAAAYRRLASRWIPVRQLARAS